MARAGLLDHRKFKRLVHILREPVPHVVGYLEVLWTTGYQQRDPFIGDKVDVELAAQFPGEPGKLCAALHEVGFIDAVPDRPGTFQVHDLYENAPRYVQIAMQRANKAPPTKDGEHLAPNGAHETPNDAHCAPDGAHCAPSVRKGKGRE